jgi:hypothetical protein
MGRWCDRGWREWGDLQRHWERLEKMLQHTPVEFVR